MLLQSIQIRLPRSSQFYKNSAWFEIVNLNHNGSGSFEIHSCCKQWGIALFWFFKNSSFGVHAFHWKHNCVRICLSTRHLPDKMLEAFTYRSCFLTGGNVSPREETEGEVFNPCKPSTKAFSFQMKLSVWNILFLIKSSDCDNALRGMVWSCKPSMEKMLPSHSWY